MYTKGKTFLSTLIQNTDAMTQNCGNVIKKEGDRKNVKSFECFT